MHKDETKIKEVLKKEVKPMLAMHLGSLDFVEFKDGILKIRFQGTCRGCSLASLTLKTGIESILKSKFSSIHSVEAVE